MTMTQRADSGMEQRKLAEMTVGDIMEKEVQSAHVGTRADVVASLTIEGFGSVPIVDEQQRLVGIVSEHDLLAILDRGQRWSDLTAREVMSGNPYTVRKEMIVATLIHVLKASDLIRVPVVDAQDKLIGIVARRDIVKAVLNAGTVTKP